jgi:hypothetical protein
MENSQQPATDRRHHVNSLLMRESLLDKQPSLCAVANLSLSAYSCGFLSCCRKRKLSS